MRCSIRDAPIVGEIPGSSRLRNDAIAIWRAGVDAVDSERLVRDCLRWSDGRLDICDEKFALPPSGRILIVGGGKAGAGMAAGVEHALAATPVAARLSGWVNVPADCVRPLRTHSPASGSPGGPERANAGGRRRITEIMLRVSQLSADDLCIVLLSGGGSALLPLPVRGISLADKQAVTRFLMSAGATINELNCVRKQLSADQGGQLGTGGAGQGLSRLSFPT